KLYRKPLSNRKWYSVAVDQPLDKVSDKVSDKGRPERSPKCPSSSPGMLSRLISASPPDWCGAQTADHRPIKESDHGTYAKGRTTYGCRSALLPDRHVSAVAALRVV